MQKRVIITGANGLLGQKVVNKLAGRGAVKLIATGPGPNRNPLRENYEYRTLDITDPEAMRQIFEQVKPTEIINCAALTHVDQCEVEKEKCQALNVDAVKTQVELCREFGARLIHISTDFIFDGENGPYREKDSPNPLSFYGKSKLLSEEAILESGIPAVILRTILLYGVIPDASRSNIVLWAKNSLEKEQDINVVNDQWRSPTLAEDLADAVVLALMKDARGIYHISGGEVMSIAELVRRIAEYFQLDESLIHEIDSKTLNQAAKRPPKTGFIILKAQTELGYRPHSLEEGLAMVERQLLDLGR